MAALEVTRRPRASWGATRRASKRLIHFAMIPLRWTGWPQRNQKNTEFDRYWFLPRRCQPYALVPHQLPAGSLEETILPQPAKRHAERGNPAMQIDAAAAHLQPPRFGEKVICLLVGAALRRWPPIRPLHLMPTRSISIPNLGEQARSWTSPKGYQAFPFNITDFTDEACHAAASPSTFLPLSIDFDSNI